MGELVHRETLQTVVDERDRLREALTWAVGFIRCNLPKTSEQYEDMRNAEDLVETEPVVTGEFQRVSARAELAEAERDRLLKEIDAVIAHVPPQYQVRSREGGGPENLAASLAVTVAKLAMAVTSNPRS